MALVFTTSHIADSVSLFHYYKKLADRAFEQLSDEQLFFSPDEESNSIAIIVKHMAGNMRSRWTDFLTSDGEKPDRDRDQEFEGPPASRAELMRLWEEGWQRLFGALSSLTDSQLSDRVMIRGEAHSVLQAINRQVCHYSYHVGQIVYVAKMQRQSEWHSLSVPRGKSLEFTRSVRSGERSQR